MVSRILRCRWADADRWRDWFGPAKSPQCDYVAIEHEPDVKVFECVERELAASPVDLVIVSDSKRPARRPALRQQLPPLMSLIAARPDSDVAVALSARHAFDCISKAGETRSLIELVVRMSATGSVSFVEYSCFGQAAGNPLPQLTTPSAGPGAPWLSRHIEGVQVPGKHSDSTEVAALKAGLFLLNDFFDESHSCSQSIEGLGRHRAGDYWHAILHRREPDYGNSKYWFRHVGRHPMFVELAQFVTNRIALQADSLATTLQRWEPRLVTERGWDPFAFVDLCEAAHTEPALRGWCEAVQYEEMLLLLESTWRDAVA
jgi:hypothetical protein